MDRWRGPTHEWKEKGREENIEREEGEEGEKE